MLVLNEQDQQSLLDMKEVIDEVANSLKAFSEREDRHTVKVCLTI